MATDKPRFMPGTTIRIRSYNGEPRDDQGEVYKAVWSYEHNDWRLAVRLITPDGAKPQFRNFFESKLVAE